MSESTTVMGSPLKRKKNEHFDNTNAALLQSPFPTSITGLNSPDAKNILGALFSPAPQPPIHVPDSKDWTPGIHQKVSLDGFSDFPESTPKGFSRNNKYTEVLMSPLLADFNEHNHDVSSSSNSHFTLNSEALRNRINKRKEVAVDGSLLSPSIHDESLLFHDSPFRSGDYRTSRTGIAEMDDNNDTDNNCDMANTQDTVNSAVSGIAMITAAALQVEPLSSQTSGSSPDNNAHLYTYHVEEYDGGNGRRKSLRASSSGHNTRNSTVTASNTSSGRKRASTTIKQEQHQIEEYMGEQDENEEENDDLVGGRRSYMSPEMKNLNMSNNSNGTNSQRNSRTSTTNNNEQINCNCKKSKCLKMYCDCFRMSETCRDSCNCMDCNNTEKHATARNHARKQILDRNPEAFKPRVKEEAREHLTGCHCRKSACLKKYCECYNGNVTCTSRCRCLDCQNLSREKKGGGGGGSAVTKTVSVSNASTRSTPAAASNAALLKKTATYPPALAAASSLAGSGSAALGGGQQTAFHPHPSPVRTVKLSAFEQSMSGSGRHSLPKSMEIMNGAAGDSLLSHSSLQYSDHSNDSMMMMPPYEPLKLDINSYASGNNHQMDEDFSPKYAPQGSPELGQYSTSKRKKAMAYRDVNQSNETSSSTSSGRPQAALALSQMSNAFSTPASPMRQSNGNNNGGVSSMNSPQKLLDLATLCELRSEEQSKEDESQDE